MQFCPIIQGGILAQDYLTSTVFCEVQKNVFNVQCVLINGKSSGVGDKPYDTVCKQGCTKRYDDD